MIDGSFLLPTTSVDDMHFCPRETNKGQTKPPAQPCELSLPFLSSLVRTMANAFGGGVPAAPVATAAAPVAAGSPVVVVVTMADLIHDARIGFNLTTRMLAESNIARELRHAANLAVHEAAAKHLSNDQELKVREAIATLITNDEFAELNNRVAMMTSALQHRHALRLHNGLVGGGGAGAKFVNPMDVVLRTRMAHQQALATQQFTAGDYISWVDTMARIKNIGHGNESFTRDMEDVFASTAARLASISDDEVTVLAQRNKHLVSRYGKDNEIEMEVENPEAFAPSALAVTGGEA